MEACGRGRTFPSRGQLSSVLHDAAKRIGMAFERLLDAIDAHDRRTVGWDQPLQSKALQPLDGGLQVRKGA